MRLTLQRATGRTTVWLSAEPGGRLVQLTIGSVPDMLDGRGQMVVLTANEAAWLVNAIERTGKVAMQSMRHRDADDPM